MNRAKCKYLYLILNILFLVLITPYVWSEYGPVWYFIMLIGSLVWTLLGDKK